MKRTPFFLLWCLCSICIVKANPVAPKKKANPVIFSYMPGHHTKLYPTKRHRGGNAAHSAVQAFVAAGIPAKKLVMGLAFYGRGRKVEDTANNGMWQKIKSRFYSGGYRFIKDNMMSQQGFTRCWDEDAKAPYLFHQKEKIFISYDDEPSVKSKCLYGKKQDMGGAMFSEYSDDPKSCLLQTITEFLN